MDYLENGCISTFHVVKKDGKFFVRFIFRGSNIEDVDDMKIYGLNGKPYVKRLSQKMYLTDSLLKELKSIS